MSKNKCPYCHPYKDDGCLYEDDISTITKNLYEAEYDYYDNPLCKVDCYQDCKIVCTGEEKYFLAVDGEWTTYFPINCCPICRRDFNEEAKKDK